MNDIERVKEVVNWLIFEKTAKNKRELASLIGYTESSFSQIINSKVSLSNSFIKKLSKTDVRINENWLLTGEGEMIQNEKPKFESNAVFLPNVNIRMIPIVSQYAYAGYLSGYSDPEYIEALPTMPFIMDHEGKGNYLGFEVKGDSMDDNTSKAVCEGDMLACRQVSCDLWQYKLHLNKWLFVIVHKTEGILVKQIIDHDVEIGAITIHSFNNFYEDRILNLKDVAQLFNVIQILRTPRL